MDNNYHRHSRLINEFIDMTSLDLNNICVLTEAATGDYWVTPIMAAMAGAHVIAYAKDNDYASANESITFVRSFAKQFNVENKINFTTKLTPALINQADIVTNIAALRPINKGFIQHLKKTAVIPLMYESWEFRNADLDLQECERREILAMGVNESHERLPVFKNVQMLILKMLFENNFEVYNNKFLLVGNDKFADNFEYILKKCGTIVIKGSAWELSNNIQNYEKIDAVIIAEYTNPDTIISDTGIIKTDDIKKFLPGALIINFSGNIDTLALNRQGILCYPKENTGNFKMAETFSYLGIEPVLELMGAGLKVGEVMHRNRLKFDYKNAKTECLKYFLCQNLNTENTTL